MRNILEINLKIRPKNGIFPSRANNAAGTFDNLDKNKNEYKEYNSDETMLFICDLL